MSIERLPSGRYRVRWRTRDKRHLSRSFRLRADAAAFERKTLDERDRHGLDVVARQDTLADLITPWWASVERSVKPRTAERYDAHRRIIEERLAHTPLRELDYDTVQRFVDGLAAVYAPRTVRGVYGVLSLIIDDAVRRRRLAGRLPKPQLPRVGRPQLTIPTRDQVEQLALACDARLHAPVLLAGYCGLREGELLALHARDVDLGEGRILVHQARNKSSGALESTKTDRVRVVHLPQRVRLALAEHLDEYPGERVVPVSASVLQKSWEAARARLGLRGIRFHDLRHAAASMMIAAGWSVRLVSQQLGHANPTQTLNTYSHLWPDSFDAAIAQLDEYIAHD